MRDGVDPMTTRPERRSVRAARRLFAYRLPRFVFILAVWPVVAISDRLDGVDPPARLKTGLRWAWTGEDQHQPTIPTASKPAAVRRGVR